MSNVKKKKIIYLETCYPDYFQGYSGETLVAFHWKNQTVHGALENLKMNALNECHEADVFEAIDRIQKELGSNELVINEKYLELDEDGNSGLVHYFGVSEVDDE